MKTKQKVYRFTFGLLLCALSLLDLGCSCPRTETTRARSFRPYVRQKIEGEDLQSFLASRVAVVIWGDDVHLPTNTPLKVWRTNDTSWKGACATAIDRRGYFLTRNTDTALNNVYVIFNSTNIITAENARVVWKSDRSKGQPDLMILHVARRLDHVFEWASDITVREKVIAVGISTQEKKLLLPECMGGKVVDFNPLKHNDAHTEIVHDAPLNPFDFGGPLVAKNGRLLGVTYTGEIAVYLIPPRWKFFYYAVYPDRRWLLDIIEKDAASLGVESGSPDAKEP